MYMFIASCPCRFSGDYLNNTTEPSAQLYGIHDCFHLWLFTRIVQHSSSGRWRLWYLTALTSDSFPTYSGLFPSVTIYKDRTSRSFSGRWQLWYLTSLTSDSFRRRQTILPMSPMTFPFFPLWFFLPILPMEWQLPIVSLISQFHCFRQIFLAAQLK
jgi:hypothetical protein